MLCAFFLAQGTTRVLAAELLAPNPDVAASSRTPVRTSRPDFARRRDSAIILRRNIFDSARGDLTAEPLPDLALGEDGQPVDEWDPSQPAPSCTNRLRLVGCVMNPSHPEWSFAAITGTSDGKTMLYREGSEVDGSRVLAVHASSVVVSSSSGACQLQMFEEEDAQAARKVATSKPAAADKPVKPGNARNAGLSNEELDEVNAILDD